ncbi:MAG TPA: HEAT repeat domain-containing protein [Candidatus Binatia bacterium]|nr:HEAT repeat domain-containing protein [Candidatus Binatia bacterium]
MKIVVLGSIALVVVAASPARSQLSTSGRTPNQFSGSSKDPTDPSTRYQKSTMGQTIENWASHLDDADPGRRLEAIRLLAESGDPQAIRYLTRAVDNPDARVATAAVDSLGKLGAKEAADALAEKLFLAGTSAALRKHILVALGRIRDPGSARRVLDFAQAEPDPDLRAVAIRVLGEIGDDSVRNEVVKLSEAETDPKLKMLLQDAAAKMAVRRPPSGGEAEFPAKFSHSEASP